MSVVLRPLNPLQDRVQLETLDTSFTTDRIYRVERAEWSFALVEQPLKSPLEKRFPWGDELDNPTWDYAVAAVEQTRLIAMAAVNLEQWNRRAVIWHLYVSPEWRGRGVGRALIDDIVVYARDNNARCLWLETNNLNYPGIQFYTRLGFRWCGLDETLYDPQGEASGEIALYFASSMS